MKNYHLQLIINYFHSEQRRIGKPLEGETRSLWFIPIRQFSNTRTEKQKVAWSRVFQQELNLCLGSLTLLYCSSMISAQTEAKCLCLPVCRWDFLYVHVHFHSLHVCLWVCMCVGLRKTCASNILSLHLHQWLCIYVSLFVGERLGLPECLTGEQRSC